MILIKGLVIRNTDLINENITERSFYLTASGSTIRLDTIDGWPIAGTGFTNGNITSAFQASDGVLAIVDSIILPPPYVSDVVRSFYNFEVPDGVNLTDYSDAIDSLYGITMYD